MMDIDAIMEQLRPRLDTHGLDSRVIRSHLGNCPWRVYLFSEVDSTNTRLKEMAKVGSPAGTVLVADRQTGGRGRLGRSFLSPGGVGVYLSALIRPDCAPTELMHLTCAVAVAMCDAVENAFGFRPGIKWTNDLVVENKKLGGILTELGFDSQGNAAWAVVGIGINCLHESKDFPQEIRSIAASLSMEAKKSVSHLELARHLIPALYEMRKNLFDAKSIMARYRKDCITLGQEICVSRAGITRYGKALAVGDDASLTVEFSDGSTEAVASGEVSVRGMYGYL